MKTLKIVAIAFLSILSFSCSNDDDSSNNTLPTTLDLLTSGTWYFESKSQAGYTACQKESSIDFMVDGSTIIKIVEESMDGCELVETINTNYILDASTITINFVDDILFGIVTYDASLQTLIITENGGGFIILDKVQG